jgi:hypothetical protein
LFVHEVTEVPGRPGFFSLFIAFKGNDPHTGMPPSVNQEACEDLAENLQTIANSVRPECRVGYVLYTGEGVAERTIDHTFGPALGFGQMPHVVPYKARMTNFLEHGYPSLGDPSNQAQYVFQELASLCWNASQHSGTLQLDFEQFAKAFSIQPTANPNNQTLRLPPHPVNDSQKIQRMKGRYKHLLTICKEYYILFRKADLRAAAAARPNPPPLPVTKTTPNQPPNNPRPSTDEPEPESEDETYPEPDVSVSLLFSFNF